MAFFQKDSLNALESINQAQWIAFAPVVFQVSLVMQRLGILELLAKNRQGLKMEVIEKTLDLSHYGTRVLLESGLGIGLVYWNENKEFFLTKKGHFVLNDKLTRINMDFMQDVCYLGMYELEACIRTGKPEGLKVFGNWNTIYEALAHLPEKAKNSWFAFDHYYSDLAFPQILPLVFDQAPKTLLDIGGNTGKWAKQCVEYDKEVHVTLADLPGQLNMAQHNFSFHTEKNRIHYHEVNLLDPTASFPQKYDAIWMSQFLDCFSDEQIKAILLKCKEAIKEGGIIYILEPFWDNQRFEASAFSLQQTSIYFTVMANGSSQMYHTDVFAEIVKESGLVISDKKEGIGVAHTLLFCKVK
jgi:ubiquinone/menaquinone biosynthesis C-methylase UbiE